MSRRLIFAGDGDYSACSQFLCDPRTHPSAGEDERRSESDQYQYTGVGVGPLAHEHSIMYKNCVVTAMEQSEKNVSFSMREAIENRSSVEHFCGQVSSFVCFL